MNPESLIETLKKPIEAIPGEFVPLWFLLSFVLIISLIVILNKIVFKPFQSLLEEREREIEGAKLKASQLKKEAENLLEKYHAQRAEVIATLIHEQTEIVKRAREEEMAILEEGTKEAKRIINESKQEIQETIARTKADLEKEIPIIVDEILKKLVSPRG